MRQFWIFVALLAAALIVAAFLTYPAWLLVGVLSEQPVHRVMHRLAQLFALIGLIVLVRRLHLSDRDSLGFGIPRRQFLRQIALGAACGLVLMTPLIAMLLLLDIREPRPDLTLNWGAVILSGAAAGLMIALIEETFFRGMLFTAVKRSSGVWAALIAPSVLYASLHFLGGKLRVPREEVGWEHGFAVLAKLFEKYADPWSFADSFLALLTLGILLALVRLRTGAIAASMGLHAAGVCVIAVTRETTVVDRASPHAWLVGSYDGVLGWAALAWLAAITIVYAFAGRTQWKARSHARY